MPPKKPLPQKPKILRLLQKRNSVLKKREKKKRTEEDVIEETIAEEAAEEVIDEAELERQRLEARRLWLQQQREKYPVAPDGQIPNSLVRKKLIPPIIKEKEIEEKENLWKLVVFPEMNILSDEKTDKVENAQIHQQPKNGQQQFGTQHPGISRKQSVQQLKIFSDEIQMQNQQQQQIQQGSKKYDLNGDVVNDVVTQIRSENLKTPIYEESIELGLSRPNTQRYPCPTPEPQQNRSNLIKSDDGKAHQSVDGQYTVNPCQDEITLAKNNQPNTEKNIDDIRIILISDNQSFVIEEDRIIINDTNILLEDNKMTCNLEKKEYDNSNAYSNNDLTNKRVSNSNETNHIDEFDNKITHGNVEYMKENVEQKHTTIDQINLDNLDNCRIFIDSNFKTDDNVNNKLEDIQNNYNEEKNYDCGNEDLQPLIKYSDFSTITIAMTERNSTESHAKCHNQTQSNKDNIEKDILTENDIKCDEKDVYNSKSVADENIQNGSISFRWNHGERMNTRIQSASNDFHATNGIKSIQRLRAISANTNRLNTTLSFSISTLQQKLRGDEKIAQFEWNSDEDLIKDVNNDSMIKEKEHDDRTQSRRLILRWEETDPLPNIGSPNCQLRNSQLCFSHSQEDLRDKSDGDRYSSGFGAVDDYKDDTILENRTKNRVCSHEENVGYHCEYTHLIRRHLHHHISVSKHLQSKLMMEKLCDLRQPINRSTLKIFS